MTPEEKAKVLAVELYGEDAEDYFAIKEMEEEMENLDNRYRKVALFLDKILPLLVKLAEKGLLL